MAWKHWEVFKRPGPNPTARAGFIYTDSGITNVITVTKVYCSGCTWQADAGLGWWSYCYRAFRYCSSYCYAWGHYYDQAYLVGQGKSPFRGD